MTEISVHGRDFLAVPSSPATFSREEVNFPVPRYGVAELTPASPNGALNSPTERRPTSARGIILTLVGRQIRPPYRDTSSDNAHTAVRIIIGRTRPPTSRRPKIWAKRPAT